MSIEIPFQPGARIVAYLRDSGGDDQDLSVPQQKQQISQWVADHNLLLTHIFADVATPGSSTIGRNAFKEMINHFHDPQCTDQGVILWKYSRFSRDIDDAQYFKADLRRRGVIIYSINDNIPDTIDGRIYEALIDWMNSRFLEDLSTDVKRGLHHIVKEYGAVPGKPPRGFKREEYQIGLHRDGTQHTISRWVPDPDWWDTCQHAWRMRAAGMPIRQIHRELRIYSSMQSYTWFFSNHIYHGELRYADIVISDYVKPMVTQEEWDAVQQLNLENSREYNPMKGTQNTGHPRRANSNFLLSGILYCVRCGALMNGDVVHVKNGRLQEYYHCGNAHRNLNCDARRIPKIIIENAVLEHLREYILDPALIEHRDRELALNYNNRVDQLHAEQKRVKAEKAKIQRRITNITNRLAEEENPPHSLMEMLQNLEIEETKKTAEFERLKSIENKETVFIGEPKNYEKLSKETLIELSSEDPARMKMILSSLIERISAERDGNVIRGMIYFYNPNLEESEESPSDKGNYMPTYLSHRREFVYTHKVFSLLMIQKIK